MGRWTVVLVSVSLAACAPPKRFPCEGVDCGPGRCVVDGDAPACLCDEGTRPDGLSCVALDGCAGVSCAALPGSTCAVVAGAAACACPEGTVLQEGRCAAKTPCLPNPCAAAFQTTCAVVGGVAACLCDPGHAPRGEGCEATPAWSCVAHVPGPDLDAAEPDGCPPRAPTVAAPAEVARSIAPAGDEDWFALPTRRRGVFAFEAQGLTQGLQLAVEIFDQAGTTRLATSAVTGPITRVTFVSPDGRPASARVRALNGGSTGDYVVRTIELGLDDFADHPDLAETIELDAGFAGRVQFGGDVDRLWLEVPAGRGVGIALHGPELQLEVWRPDARTALANGEAALVASESSQQLLLSVSGQGADAVGDFEVELLDLGPDDHAGGSAFATPLAADGLGVAGTIERAEDVDVFAVQQRAGRVYRARWQGLSGNSLPRVTVLEPSGAVLATSSSGAVAVSWVATADARVTLSVINPLVSFSAAKYAIAVDELAPDDHGDSNATATAAQLAVPVEGRVDLERDLDVFSVTPAPGRILRATLTSPFASSTLKVSIRQPSGAVVAGDLNAAVLVTEPGAHFVVVQAASAVLTPYTLVLTDDGLDDHPDAVAGASMLPFGAWVSGRSQFADDVDVFTFTPTAGHVYRLSYEHDAEPWPCSVHDAAGDQVFGPVVPTGSPFFTPQGGTWSLRVKARSLGSFRVRLDEVGADDHAPTPASATLVTVGTPTPGRADFAGDRDTFRFVATARRIYEVTLTGGPDLRLEHVAPDGGLIKQGLTGTVRLSFGSEQPAYFSVVNRSPDFTPSYTVNVVALGLDDHGGTNDSATPLALGASVTGVIDFTEDVDLFVVPAGPGGRHLRARCEVQGGWCPLIVLDAAGNEVTQTDLTGTAWFRPPAGASQLFFFVSASSQQDYTVSFIDAGPDDVGETAATAQALVVGAPALSRSLEVPHDVDAFSLTLDAGDLIAVSCQRSAGAPCELQLRTPTGTVLPDWPFGFRASVAGTYLLEVTSSVAGAYSLAVAFGADDHGNSAAAATPLALGQQATGHIDYQGDVDVFTVTLVAGEHITVESTPDCRVNVRRPNNVNQATSFEGLMEFIAVVDGVHAFHVSQCGVPYGLVVMR